MASNYSHGGAAPRAIWCHMLLLVAGLFNFATAACAKTVQPRQSPCTVTWNGNSVTGSLINGVCRTTVRYGTASRWADPMPATSQSGFSASAFPVACPQQESSELNFAPQAEDCLFATIYAPSTGTNHPILVWVHGGSFVVGSASSPGLDGAALARDSNIVVVVIQYRLGALGLLPPQVAPTTMDPNLAVRDVILALMGVKANAASFRGDPTRITVGGQSSGAGLIRALWMSSLAQGNFHRMIMQSDPLTYGMANQATTNALRTMLYSNQVFAGRTTLAQMRAVPFQSIMTAQRQLWSSAPGQIAGVPMSEPIRPTFNVPTITSEPTEALFTGSTLAVSAANVPLLITTVAHEAGNIAGKTFPNPIPAVNATYNGVLAGFLGPARANAVSSSPHYSLPAGPDTLRETLTRALTDGAWKCAAREAALHYASRGGTVYVGEFLEGKTYISNSVVSYCSGRVCHQDDILPTFNQGTGTLKKGKGRSRQTTQVRDAWTSFIKTGNPGSGWNAFPASAGISGTGVKALGTGSVSSCPANFWGNTVKWDWQLYN